MDDPLKTCCVYILECRGGSLYTGWTNNLSKRLAEHAQGKGARYTRSRLPVKLVYHEVCESASDAMKREAQIKKYSRQQKLALKENKAAAQ
ncbi:MAG: GIY-YIG nuclease family protein [Clostridiales bacterium]|nr:GIY-YIG nuclease family protein [Clostridiales bacterium]